MSAEASGSPRDAEPQRHSATLGSLSCPLCGAGPFVECDITTHQDYANSQYDCSVCGAAVGEICLPECPAADTLIKVLAGVHPEIAGGPLIAW